MNYPPLEQFKIKKILIYHLYVKCPVFDVSITNGSITLLLILISYGLFNLKTIRSSYAISSVWRFITESLFSFISQIISMIILQKLYKIIICIMQINGALNGWTKLCIWSHIRLVINGIITTTITQGIGRSLLGVLSFFKLNNNIYMVFTIFFNFLTARIIQRWIGALNGWTKLCVCSPDTTCNYWVIITTNYRILRVIITQGIGRSFFKFFIKKNLVLFFFPLFILESNLLVYFWLFFIAFLLFVSCEFWLIIVLLYCYKQLNYILSELISPIIYIVSQFNKDLKLLASAEFNLWMNPLLGQHETDKDDKIFQKLLKLNPSKIYVWQLSWWKCFFFIIMWLFIEFNCMIFGYLYWLGITFFYKKPKNLFLFSPGRRNFFSIAIPRKYFGNLRAIDGFGPTSFEFSWCNLYRFYTFSNCLFFIFSIFFYILNLIFLGDFLFLSKLWKPGLFIFLGCLYISLLFADKILPLIAPILRKLVKKSPKFFESSFFPLYYLFYIFEKPIIVLIFYLVFKGYNGFLLIFFIWYILKFWISTSILILSQLYEDSMSIVLDLDNYASNYITGIVNLHFNESLDPNIHYKDSQRLFNQLCFSVNRPKITYVSKKAAKESCEYCDSFKLLGSTKYMISSNDPLIKDIVMYKETEGLDLDVDGDLCTIILRKKTEGLDIDVKYVSFLYPQYLINFLTETVPDGLKKYTKIKNKVTKPINVKGVRQFHSSSVNYYPGGKDKVCEVYVEVSAKFIMQKFAKLLVNHRRNLEFTHIDPFLSQSSFMGIASHYRFFDSQILGYAKKIVKTDNTFQITRKSLDSIVSKALFSEPFVADNNPSLSTTLVEGFSSQSAKIQLGVDTIYRVGIPGSCLDIFMLYGGSIHVRDCYVPHFGTPSQGIISAILKKQDALRNNDVMGTLTKLSKKCPDSLLSLKNSLAIISNKSDYSVGVMVDYSFASPEVINEVHLWALANNVNSNILVPELYGTKSSSFPFSKVLHEKNHLMKLDSVQTKPLDDKWLDDINYLIPKNFLDD